MLRGSPTPAPLTERMRWITGRSLPLTLGEAHAGRFCRNLRWCEGCAPSTAGPLLQPEYGQLVTKSQGVFGRRHLPQLCFASAAGALSSGRPDPSPTNVFLVAGPDAPTEKCLASL